MTYPANIGKLTGYEIPVIIPILVYPIQFENISIGEISRDLIVSHIPVINPTKVEGNNIIGKICV
jgi:hypothetical protein